MKNKGFTLIELLAVIVILGLIAVITIPKINKSVDDSKKNIAKASAYQYKKVVNEYTIGQKLNKNTIELNGKYRINENGYLYNNNNTIEVDFSGEKPKSGTLVYINNELQSGCITINKYAVTFENGEVTDTEKGDCEKILQEKISKKVDSYVKAALAANSSITGETAKTVSEMSNVTTNPADSGWIRFNTVNGSIVVVDYSLTYGDLTANYSSLTNGNYVSTFGEVRNKPVIVGSTKCFGPTDLQECFKIISTNSSTTLLFANYNLKKYTDNTTNPATVTYKQESSSPDTIKFSNNSNYWHDSTTSAPKSKYATDINGNEASYYGYPYPYVYDSNSLTYEYIEGYLKTLKTATYGLPSSATGRLLTYEESNDTTMFANNEARANGKSYWLGSVRGNTEAWKVANSGYIDRGTVSYSGSHYNGVRPVIVISTSDI